MCIVVGWYWIFKESLLAKVPKGVVGIHASLLPKYRGGSPLVWPIIKGDKESGLSLFYLDKGMDTGDVIAQKRFSIMDDDTIAEVLEKAESLTVELLEQNYPLLLEGTASRIQQNHDEATYFPQRKPEDGRIDWNATNVEIHNAIRAQTHPYPGAFCYTEDNKRLYIWKSRLFPQEHCGIPGLVVQVLDDSVVVACGKGALCLCEVQLESSVQEIAGRVLKYITRLR
jgi:methionyl-tRNA formyltransferase